MKRVIAAAAVLLLAGFIPAHAEAVITGSDMQAASSARAGATARTQAARGGVAGRRASLMPLVRSAKPGRLPLSLVDAVITNESGYRAGVRGSRGEVGLMQILPATARSIARQTGLGGVAGLSGSQLVRYLSVPRNNLRVGLAYLNWCYGKANGDVGATIGCYNAGPGNMWRWNRIAVTRNYVRRVRSHMARGYQGS